MLCARGRKTGYRREPVQPLRVRIGLGSFAHCRA